MTTLHNPKNVGEIMEFIERAAMDRLRENETERLLETGADVDEVDAEIDAQRAELKAWLKQTEEKISAMITAEGGFREKPGVR
jgi:hypothetical protein